MSWSEVIVHHSAGGDTDGAETQAYRRYHVDERGWRDIGYHFVVERLSGRYEAIVGRPLNRAGAHCPGHNSTAIGVCLAGDFSETAPPMEQLDVAARLIAGLCDALGIETDAIHPHKSFRQTECPGEAFDLVGFRGMVEAARGVA